MCNPRIALIERARFVKVKVIGHALHACMAWTFLPEMISARQAHCGLTAEVV